MVPPWVVQLPGQIEGRKPVPGPTAMSNILSASGATMFHVVRPQRAGGGAASEGGANFFTSGGYLGLALLDVGGANKFAFYRYNGGYVSVVSNTTYSTNTWYIVETWYEGTNLNIKVN